MCFERFLSIISCRRKVITAHMKSLLPVWRSFTARVKSELHRKVNFIGQRAGFTHRVQPASIRMQVFNLGRYLHLTGAHMIFCCSLAVLEAPLPSHNRITEGLMVEIPPDSVWYKQHSIFCISTFVRVTPPDILTLSSRLRRIWRSIHLHCHDGS